MDLNKGWNIWLPTLHFQRFYIATSRQLRRLDSVSRSPIYSHFGETVSGLSVIRAYGHQERFLQHNSNTIDENLKSVYPWIVSNRFYTCTTSVLFILMVLPCGMLTRVLVSADGWPSDWSLLETWWCSSPPCLLSFPETRWTVAWSACLFPTLSMWVTLWGQVITVTAPAVTLRNLLIVGLQVTQTLNWLVRMNSELETNIVAVERVSEYCEIENEVSFMRICLTFKIFLVKIFSHFNTNLVFTGSVDYWQPTWW